MYVIIHQNVIIEIQCTINVMHLKVKICHVQLFVTLWTIVCQALPSMGFSRQEYRSGLPFPPPGDLPDPGIEPRSPTLQAPSLQSESTGKPHAQNHPHPCPAQVHGKLFFIKLVPGAKKVGELDRQGPCLWKFIVQKEETDHGPGTWHRKGNGNQKGAWAGRGLHRHARPVLGRLARVTALFGLKPKLLHPTTTQNSQTTSWPPTYPLTFQLWSLKHWLQEEWLDSCTSPHFLGSENLPSNAGDTGDVGSIPGLGRSPGGGNSNSFQYSCLENPMDRGAWQLQSIGSQRLG